MTTVGIKEL